MDKEELAEKIEVFLRIVDADFEVPISSKVNISSFARKLSERASVFYIMENDMIVSMVAGYIENAVDDMAYVSICATSATGRHKGFAHQLLKKFIDESKQANLSAVHVYTTQNNTRAIKLYKKLGFVEWRYAGESRPEDVHLINKLR